MARHTRKIDLKMRSFKLCVFAMVLALSVSFVPSSGLVSFLGGTTGFVEEGSFNSLGTGVALAYDSAAQQAAVDRINYYRSLAGIPLAHTNDAIRQAAQNHAEYMANNHADPRQAGLGFHEEYSDLAGFTGHWPWDRAGAQGFSGGLGEDGNFIGEPNGAIDSWMETVYHRDLILMYAFTEVGYGSNNDGRGKWDVLDMGSQSDTRPGSRLVFTYPADGQPFVPQSWNGAEVPDPAPGMPRPLGYPISLYIQTTSPSPGGAKCQVSLAELRDSNGQVVSTYLREPNNDSNLGSDTVFVIPTSPLAVNAVYTAHVAGTDSQGAPFDKTWSFGTGQDAPRQSGPAPVSDPNITYFAETGHSIGNGFRSFWEQHGGLAQFGYPLTDEIVENSPTDGQPRTTQYFERARFEYHPEFKGTPYEVELGLLGKEVTSGRAFPTSDPFPSNANGWYFPETQHSLAFGFLSYWLSHGGVTVFGYPISQELVEVNPTDGKEYIVQYFERNRFEFHPEFKGTSNEVLLGQLGREVLVRSGRE
jgi:uncharacterized protein YkwD